jgi:hypothetical protein
MPYNPVPPGSNPPLADAVAAAFGALPAVVAVALAGSRTGPLTDDRSDIDLYVYAREPIPAASRIAIMHQFTDHGGIDERFWEPGDEWIEARTGQGVDIIYRTPRGIEEALDRMLVQYRASIGYSTALWYNVLTSTPLQDRSEWFRGLQAWANRPYPAELRRAIIAKNHPILRGIMSSLLHQLESAVLRRDLVSVNHRVTAILASYFDIVFAVNERPHPGEKRLVEHVLASCAKVPPDMQHHIVDVLGALAPAGDNQRLVHRVNRLLDGLDALVRTEGLG